MISQQRSLRAFVQRCYHPFSSLSTAVSDVRPAVQIVEVGPRDGLQNEVSLVSVEDKVTLLERLVHAGCNRLEAGSFVHPKAVPAMVNTPQVMERLNRDDGLRRRLQQASFATQNADDASKVKFSCLVPNVKYLQQALLYQPDEIAIFASASETFSQTNIHCSIAESLERYRLVAEQITAHSSTSVLPDPARRRLRGYVSCVMACPYEGVVDPGAVARVAEQLLELGCHELSLGDTIGVGTPASTRRLLEAVLVATGNQPDRLAVHFHDT